MNCRIMLVALLAVVSVGSGALATEYQFTPISLSNVGNHFAKGVTLDELGNVYFVTFDSKIGTALERGDGITPATALIEPGVFSLYSEMISVNTSGDVAFGGRKSGEPDHVYRLVQGDLQQIDVTPLDFPAVAMNDNRVVAYVSSFGPNVYTSVDPSNPIYIVPSSSQELGRALAISNADQTAFIKGEGSDFSLQLVDSQGNVTMVTDGNEFITIADWLDVNDQGTFVFAGLSREFVAGIFSWKDGVTSLLASHDPYFALNTDVQFAINNYGEIAFRAGLRDGGNGIFTGDDPATDAVIQVGDPLAGSTLTNLNFWGGFNDAGQIAFWGGLADGRVGIFRADPVPEPTSLVLAAIGGIALILTARRRTGL